MSREASSGRFLIVRLSAVGDTIFSLPVACALRRHNPQAFIAWVVEPLSAMMVRTHDCLDEVIVVPRGWWKSPAELRKLRCKLAELEIDTTLDLQSLTKSALVARLSGARRRLGFTRPWGRELSLVLNNERVRVEADHVVNGYLEILKPLGIVSPQVEFRIPPDDKASGSMLAFVTRELKSQPFAVINPAASWPSKIWPIDRYGEVARYLGEQHGLRSIVLWYGDIERVWAEQIVSGSQGQALLAPPTKLNEVAALARQACLFLSSDTGPLHLAAAVGTPCVGLYGTSRVGRCGPYGSQHIALQAYYQDGTSRQRRSAANLAMQAITVAQVCDACEEIFIRGRAADRATPAAGLPHSARPHLEAHRSSTRR